MRRRPDTKLKALKKTWPLRKNGISLLWTRLRSVGWQGVSSFGCYVCEAIKGAGKGGRGRGRCADEER